VSTETTIHGISRIVVSPPERIGERKDGAPMYMQSVKIIGDRDTHSFSCFFDMAIEKKMQADEEQAGNSNPDLLLAGLAMGI
jgi:hypothetical protein